ncbi:hypothetical protein GOBAR_AA01744 [Gossypium barbadense]|uniref:USP domain-containing protein n=1 Tax=Gossypium barbadense TaxID=3634 RepID=A0A2P5YTB4_GOSBA|nr:hypothetical protein GOBAR_AA01744 [Gossypium barbadense]
MLEHFSFTSGSSGKCQIVHWRQGHKDECHPATDFAAKKRSGIQSYGCEVEIAFKKSFDPSSVVENGDGNLKPRVDAIATHSAFAPSSSSSLAGVSPSCTSSESLVDVSPSRTLMSGHNDKLGRQLSDDIANGIPKSRASAKNMKEAISPSSESNNLSKLNKKKSSHEEVEFRRQLTKSNNLMHDGAHPTKAAYNKSTGAVSSEFLVTDASKKSNLTSLSASRPRTVISDREDDLLLDESLPAKSNAAPTLPQTTSNGLRMSLRKVVQQIKTSKQSKSHLFGFGNEGDKKHNYKIIFPYELFMELYSYDAVELCPFGLNNCGNSCYANAVLQCLAFTQPLTSYLVKGLHSKACKFLAKEGESPLSPIRILSKIQKIGSNLGPGKEEDAHEFLRYAVDAMQSVCLKEARAAGPLAEETSLIGLTFGGYLHSKIKCMKCLGKSELYERMMDLTVEIDGDIGSLEEALAQFTAREILDGENKYHCIRCKSYVKASKKLTVLESPNILTIVLKRFQSGNFGKLNKSVQFPEVLDLAPYMSGSSSKVVIYNLYAVVVHLDVMDTAFSGHYVCYVKNFRGEWFRIDDSTVIPVSLERVLLERAYMLLYARRSPIAPALVRKNLDSHGFKHRNLEAVPCSQKTSKSGSDSNFSKLDPSISQRKHKYHPPMQRISSADSSSESSSIFSGSDASSCSTTSTKDSSRSEDFSDYLFGEMGPEWYNQNGISSETAASSSYHGFDTDLGAEMDGRSRSLTFLYTDSIRQHWNSNVRASDFEQGGWSNPFDVRSSGISYRRASVDGSTQTFY